ncbi:MAG: late competence development ComFB family protein [Desulfovibrionaceae bacterium]|nr:late competence development ComFB family protein [Desulfovibrionaceae bacterium]MDD4952305.1 late competence development ComFB family protein [Desulfovibrionaceae bacterium]
MGRYKELFFHEDLENMAEEILFEELHSLIEQGDRDFCTCSVCIQDVAAIVLNKVPPLYSCSILEKTSPNEGFFRRIEEVRGLIRRELPVAIDKVSSSNNH